jgi:hypothetical protein
MYEKLFFITVAEVNSENIRIVAVEKFPQLNGY